MQTFLKSPDYFHLYSLTTIISLLWELILKIGDAFLLFGLIVLPGLHYFLSSRQRPDNGFLLLTYFLEILKMHNQVRLSTVRCTHLAHVNKGNGDIKTGDAICILCKNSSHPDQVDYLALIDDIMVWKDGNSACSDVFAWDCCIM